MPAQPTMDDEQHGVRALLLGDEAPPIRSGRGRRLMLLTSAGLLLSAMGLVILFNLDEDDPPITDASRFGAIADIVPPGGLSEADISRAGTGLPRDPTIELPSGAWIQVADEAGRLAQQYRFASLDPSPAGAGPGYLQMRSPEAEIFLSGGRVLTLSGDAALAYVPASLLESGDIEGEVIIRLFQPREGRPPDLRTDEPALVAVTSRARFDNMVGEIICDEDVHVESRSLEFDGRQLRLQINDRDGTIHLNVREPGPIRIARVEGSAPASAFGPSPAMSAAPPSTPGSSSTPSPGAALQRSAPPAPALDAEFYRLTMHEQVVIVQGGPGAERRVTGDDLELVFSMDREGLEHPLAIGPIPVRSEHFVPLPLAAWAASAAIASLDEPSLGVAPPPSSEDIIVTCTGPLTLVPVSDASERLSSAEDARLVLRGRPVELNDAASGSRATCSMLVHHSMAQRTELHAGVGQPVRLAAPDLAAEGQVFWMNHAEDRAGFMGEGAMVGTRAAPQLATGPVEPSDQEPLRITWVDGVDLEFDDGGAAVDESAKLRRANFSGNVEVMSEELYVNSDRLAVAFEPNAQGKSEASSIEANGSVRARSLGDPGSLRCSHLVVELSSDEAGDAIPSTMTATGGVEAMDDQKIIWADSIFVRFSPPRKAADEAAETDAGAEHASPLDEADIEFFTAEGAVQVVLDQGGRVFADRVVGDNAKHTMTLVGRPVRVIYDAVVFERDTEVVITERAGVYRLDGPGKATIYPASVQPEGRERIAPPAITADPEIQAQWSETMIYDSVANHGAGSLDFRGAVNATATPSKLEENFIQGDSLVLEFETAPTASRAEIEPRPAPAGPGESGTFPGDSREDRRIRKLIARGSAELESRTWLDEWHGDKPRVFNVAGDHVEYDDHAGEAIVVGDGRLLIRDERVEPADESTPALDEHRPFGRKGTSLFKWNEKLHMTRAPDGLHRVMINGDVEVLHRAIDGAVATMTCRELEATIQRKPTVGGDAAGAQEPQDRFNLGGSAEVRYLRAEERVYIKTPAREIECRRFMYDAERQVAEIAAGAGSFASILTVGSGQTQRVERAIWDLAADAITIEQGSGTIPR